MWRGVGERRKGIGTCMGGVVDNKGHRGVRVWVCECVCVCVSEEGWGRRKLHVLAVIDQKIHNVLIGSTLIAAAITDWS